MPTALRVPFFFALWILVLVSSGCVSSPEPRARFAGVHKIAVIFGTDEGMHGTCVGTTVFNNEQWDAPQVRLDTHKWAREEFVSASPSLYKFVEGTPEAASILAHEYRPSMWSFPKPPSPEELKSLGAKEGVQLIVVLTSAPIRDFIGDTNVGLPCQGYYHRGMMGIHFDVAYFTAYVRVFDVRAGDMIGVSMAWHSDVLKDMSWPKSWDQLPPDKQVIMKNAIERAVRVAVAAKIKELRFSEISVQ